jgi:hypothetical protein
MVPTIHEPDTVAISEPESINMNTATNASMTNVKEHPDEHKGNEPICKTNVNEHHNEHKGDEPICKTNVNEHKDEHKGNEPICKISADHKKMVSGST